MNRISTLIALALCVCFLATSCDNKPKEEKNAVVTTTENAIDKKEDPCLLVLNRLYNDYVFSDNIDGFYQAVDELFTAKCKQKLMDAYDYDCDGICYAIWEFRTSAQDGVGESKVTDITPMGDNKYTVKYLDMNLAGETMFVLVEDNGVMKIDDYRRIFDGSLDENVGQTESNELLLVPSWVLGKWEIVKNEIIEITPSGFVYTVNGNVVDQGPINVIDGLLVLEGEKGAFYDEYNMAKEKLYIIGGDGEHLDKLSK